MQSTPRRIFPQKINTQLTIQEKMLLLNEDVNKLSMFTDALTLNYIAQLRASLINATNHLGTPG